MLTNQKVLIVGFGQSGQAALRFCLQQGARPAVTDVRDAAALREATEDFKGFPVDWFLGEHAPAVFVSADRIVVSPGVPPHLKPLQAARAKQIPIVSELELACQAMADGKQKPKVIAVTGTNGKSTTVMLIHHLLTGAGKKSLLAGNIGRPVLDCLAEIPRHAFLVLEISSYQMETTPSLKPDTAVWLNATEDHLHWHETFEAYVAAKWKLIRQTAPEGMVIYNGEDRIVTQCVEQTPAPRRMFSAKRRLPWGGWVEEGKLMVKGGPKDSLLVFDLAPLPLKGIPNWENMLAALLAVIPYIKDRERLQKGLETFVPLAHRMETVAALRGVTYINDSKGTNVGAAVKALAGTPAPILWIAGGQEKGGSYAPLFPWVKKKSGRFFCMGRQRQRWMPLFAP